MQRVSLTSSEDRQTTREDCRATWILVTPEYAIVGGETLTVLDHVFVPWDRVFMCGETDFAQDYVARFAAYHRQNYGGCKVGNSDVLIGATSMIAKMNGTEKEQPDQG